MEKNGGKRHDRVVLRAGVSPVESNKKIGPIRSHLYAYALAKSEARRGRDAKIIFRIDDTDGEKHTKEAGRNIYAFFSEVLGLDFDITPENSHEKIGQSVFQSERREFYERALEELFDKKIAFVDKDSGLVLFDIEKFGEQYGDLLQIEDMKMGKIKRSIEALLRNGTRLFPIMRSDKSALYHLASVVDDGEFGVTHVVRGKDKMSIIEFQEMVRVALGLEPKRYLHTPLLLNEEGKMLGRAVKFENFIAQGFLPHAIISYMVSSGYGEAGVIYPSLDEFIDQFDYRKIHKSNGKFDPARLRDINKRMIKESTEEVVGISFDIFLKTRSEGELGKIFENDRALRRALFLLKREFEESLSWIKKLLQPSYEVLTAEEREHAERVIEFLRKKEEIPSAEDIHLPKKELFNALRWVIGGSKEMPNIELAFAYIKERGLVAERREFARNALGAA